MYRPLSIALAGLGLLASACFDADFQDGVIACGEAGCPDGLVCHTDGLCYRDPPGGGGPGDDGTEPPPQPTSTANVALAIANSNAPDRLYAACNGELGPIWSTPDSRLSTSVAWGDLDRDGDPEVVYGAFGAASIAYDVEDTIRSIWQSQVTGNTRSIALHDLDRDDDADLILGNEGQSLRVFEWIFNDGSFRERWISESAYSTTSVDIVFDDPGHNDYNLAIGVSDGPNVVFHFDEDGSRFPVWTTPEADDTREVAWGDYDEDGRPDLAVANWTQPTRVYHRDGFGEYSLVWSSNESGDKSTSVAWADFDGDGDPDLAVGNWNQRNRVYRNDRSSFSLAWSSDEIDKTTSVAWADFDGDGDPDLAFGNDGEPNRVYRNDDGATFELAWSSPERDMTTGVAWAVWEKRSGELGLCAAAGR